MQNTEEEEVRQGTGVSWNGDLCTFKRSEERPEVVVDKYRRQKSSMSAHKIPNNMEFGGQLSLLRKHWPR